ncbi:MAG: antibiotic biosynthesis monooxygenase [Ilumatobacteraceae bacterium]
MSDPTQLAPLAATPYVAVIFSSRRTAVEQGYDETAEAMEQLAMHQPGYIGIESARSPDGFGITVSYWATDGDARAWKQVVEHLDAQRRGQTTWYEQYVARVATVERQYGWARDARPSHDGTAPTE